MTPKTVSVALCDAVYSFDMLYSYLTCEDITAGCRVLVPFGRSDRLTEAMVFSVSESDGSPLKYVLRRIDDSPVMNEEQLALAVWLKDNTFCTYYDAIKTLLPAGIRCRLNISYKAVKGFEGLGLDASELELCQKLSASRGGVRISGLSADERRCLEKLEKLGAVAQSVKAGGAIAAGQILRLKPDADTKLLTKAQKPVVAFLRENQSASLRELTEYCDVSAVVLKNLVAAGILEAFDNHVNSSAPEASARTELALTPPQQEVFDRVCEKLDRAPRSPAAFLLHGVTGSGKTVVFAKLIEKTLASGHQAILLIPEISLSPQTAGYFRSVFGETVAVLHSGLPISERLEQYRRIKSGEARLVVGTRSAIFAPCSDIGLIVIDEEGERTYKSESAPRYNAIAVAKKRCAIHHAVLLLASATPTIESYYLAQKGVYELLELNTRYSGFSLPETEIVDMSESELCGKSGSFSLALVQSLSERLNAHEQSILLLNRRGYNTLITCTDCHKPAACPNCSIPLTYHKDRHRLQCHYCGFGIDYAGVCPTCGGKHIRASGFGTQRLEEELQELLPGARILRMDADSASNGFAFDEKLGAFAHGDYDIMLGTQMIGKGLDFPNVTLVGVLSVDKALFSGDFKSYERTFALITQVIGRGGRGKRPGRAILQTFMPDHYVLQLAALQSYRRFYDEEIALRRTLVYPPICDICVIGISHREDEQAAEASKAVLDIIRKIIADDKPDFPLRVLGPARCSYERIDGKYRYRIIMKCKNTAAYRGFISKTLSAALKRRELDNASIYADINGEIGL